MSGNPLGQGTLGQIRLGDRATGGRLPRAVAMGLTYSIAQSQHSVSMGLTYTIQAGNVAIMQLYYVISPPQGFSINGDTTIVSPDQVTYTPIPVIARTLLANPLIQGYRMMTWTYSTLQRPEVMHLLSFYNPANPQVILTYANDDGVWVQRKASMLPPNYGAEETVVQQGFTLSFLLLSDS